MEGKLTVPVLKRTLLEEVRSFFRPNRSAWKAPILDVFSGPSTVTGPGCAVRRDASVSPGVKGFPG